MWFYWHLEKNNILAEWKNVLTKSEKWLSNGGHSPTNDQEILPFSTRCLIVFILLSFLRTLNVQNDASLALKPTQFSITCKSKVFRHKVIIYQQGELKTNAIIYFNKQCICLLFTLVAKRFKIAQQYLILVSHFSYHRRSTMQTYNLGNWSEDLNLRTAKLIHTQNLFFFLKSLLKVLE